MSRLLFLTLLSLTLILPISACSSFQDHLLMDFKGEQGASFHVEATGGVLSDTVSNIMSTYEIGPDGTLKVAQGGTRNVDNKNQGTVFSLIANNVKEAVLAGIGAAFGGSVAGPVGAGLGAAAGLAAGKVAAPAKSP